MAGIKKRRGVSPPKDETKEQRFIRVASSRVGKAVKAINNIGHCASTNYVYTEEQVKDIDRALTVAVERTLDKFTVEEVEPSGFRFSQRE